MGLIGSHPPSRSDLLVRDDEAPTKKAVPTLTAERSVELV